MNSILQDNLKALEDVAFHFSKNLLRDLMEYPKFDEIELTGIYFSSEKVLIQGLMNNGSHFNDSVAFEKFYRWMLGLCDE